MRLDRRLDRRSGKGLNARAPRPKLWITGISGFLGWHLAQVAQPRWQVYGTYHQHPIQVPGAVTAPLDLRDAEAIAATLAAQQPTAVIHTAAISKPNVCQQHPEVSRAVNVTATEHLARSCAAAQVPLVFTSSNLVFDGQCPPYCETAPPHPVNLYGEQKADAEQRLQAVHPQAVICRLPLMFGPATPTATSFLQDFLGKLRSGQPLTLFTDEYRMPADARAIAAGLLLAVQHPGLGILHLAGADRLSRYDMGQLLVQIWDITSANLHPCRQVDVPMPAPRPPDLSMDTTKAQQLGYRPMAMDRALEAIRREEIRQREVANAHLTP
ncbi:MAG: SDR family oxidoreductase [Cyanobacteria bacterium P01_A01_bin.105]